MPVESESQESEEREARQALARIPFVSAGARLTRLRGFTNRVYKVETADGTFALRLPGKGARVDRKAEETNASAAAEIGIAPEILFFDQGGVMLTRFIEGEPMSAAGFWERAGAVERAAQALRRLHESAKPFATEFKTFDFLETYLGILTSRELPRRGEIEALAGDLRAEIEANPGAKKPCHCDPTGPNLIDTGQAMYLIDWEYSAMNDPFWDLGYLAAEGELDAAMEGRLLASYLGRAPEENDVKRLALFRNLTDLLSGLWELAQDLEGNRAQDFGAEGARRLARALASNGPAGTGRAR
jgi:thiamine kinase-like enzyme